VTATPIPHPAPQLGGRRERNRNDVDPGRSEGWGEGVLRSEFNSHCSPLI